MLKYLVDTCAFTKYELRFEPSAIVFMLIYLLLHYSHNLTITQVMKITK